MIIVNIGLDGKPDIQRIILGNKYENNDETINFVLPDEINQLGKKRGLVLFLFRKKG